MLGLNQGAGVLSSSLEPIAGPSHQLVLGVAAAVWVGACAVRWRLPPSDPIRSELGRWLSISVAALGGLVAAWLVIVPANSLLYEPGYPGSSNRINVFAGLWLCLLAYAMAMLLAALVARGLRRGLRWRRPLGLLLATVIAGGYAGRIATDESHWALSAQETRRDLNAIHAALPTLPPFSNVLLFDTPGFAAPGVPVFFSNVDLGGAVKLLYGSPSVGATPILQSTPLACTLTEAVPKGPLDRPAPYGRAFAVDALARRAPARIGSRGQCMNVLRTFSRLPLGPPPN
jgi:hypothetical protein